MHSLVFFLLFAVVTAAVLTKNTTIAMSTESDIATDKARLDAARELAKILYEEDHDKDAKTPDNEDIKKLNKHLEALSKLKKPFEPLTEDAKERRNEITARFLAQKLTEIESKSIIEYLRTGTFEKLYNIIAKSINDSMIKCGFKPNFEIDLSEDVDAQKLSLVRQLAGNNDLRATGLPMLACGSLLMENTLARELTVEELNTQIAFETSEAGRKFGMIIENTRYQRDDRGRTSLR